MHTTLCNMKCKMHTSLTITSSIYFICETVCAYVFFTPLRTGYCRKRRPKEKYVHVHVCLYVCLYVCRGFLFIISYSYMQNSSPAVYSLLVCVCFLAFVCVFSFQKKKSVWKEKNNRFVVCMCVRARRSKFAANVMLIIIALFATCDMRAINFGTFVFVV